jgi:hypothetical protein
MNADGIVLQASVKKHLTVDCWWYGQQLWVGGLGNENGVGLQSCPDPCPLELVHVGNYCEK